MRLFTIDNLAGALQHAADGGQALLVGTGHIARLYDRDAARLKRTAHELGVDRPRIVKANTVSQHVPLIGHPRQRAETRAQLNEALTMGANKR